jgi:hypothetical protein
VPTIAEVPPPAYRFAPRGPAGAPGPYRADEVLAAEAPRHQGCHVRRAWRERLDGADEGTWLYVVQISPGGDVLRAYSGISSTLNVAVRLVWPIEVVTEESLLPPYQAAALTAADQVWSA